MEYSKPLTNETLIKSLITRYLMLSPIISLLLGSSLNLYLLYHIVNDILTIKEMKTYQSYCFTFGHFRAFRIPPFVLFCCRDPSEKYNFDTL